MTEPSSAPRVFIARRIPDEGLRLLLDGTDADLWEDELPPPRDELLRRVAGVEGLLSLLTDRVDDELLDAAGPQLKVVSNYAVGFDNVDVPACTRRDIPVGNTPDVLTETTADLAFALLMAAARRIPEGYDYVRADRWQTWGPMLLLSPDVHHATLGIVGFGRIGREMAKRARGFDMEILYHDVQQASPEDEAALHARSVEMDELLAESDFISLHTNLTPETHHLLDEAAFARMKPTAIVINTSRGPVIDQRALFEALRDRVIGGAALDVTDPEPMRADDPLLTQPNALVVPHVASASHTTRGRMAEMAAANLLAGLRGERLPTPVNPEVYEGR
ncbi:MAG: D-glycerate dehydrogenase [Chloroflexi bacterium]|nr:D-glycerate dehydrogenase [Chloroflexota bacterium]